MKQIKDIVTRIIIALALLMVRFNIFYFLLSKITLYGSLPLLYLLGYSMDVAGNNVFIDGQSLEFISACVATSAYYLLALLILLTKDIKLKDRLYLMLYGSLLILIMNIIRIDILLYVLVEFGQNWFEKFHIFFWHVVSSIYVALVWIFLSYKFKVEGVPIYSDFKYLLSLSVFGRKKRSRKRKKS